ncbi:MAG: hypothetical protein AABW50_00125 [Nanoarchaeota archaeon]
MDLDEAKTEIVKDLYSKAAHNKILASNIYFFLYNEKIDPDDFAKIWRDNGIYLNSGKTNGKSDKANHGITKSVFEVALFFSGNYEITEEKIKGLAKKLLGVNKRRFRDLERRHIHRR